jgi:hypothetical protein
MVASAVWSSYPESSYSAESLLKPSVLPRAIRRGGTPCAQVKALSQCNDDVIAQHEQFARHLTPCQRSMNRIWSMSCDSPLGPRSEASPPPCYWPLASLLKDGWAEARWCRCLAWASARISLSYWQHRHHPYDEGQIRAPWGLQSLPWGRCPATAGIERSRIRRHTAGVLGPCGRAGLAA